MDPFTANFCFVEDDGASVKVGLADDQSDTCRYVLFERLKAPSAQDLTFGFDAPHFEIDDQGYSGYGLLEKVVLTGSVLSICPNDEGKRVLQTQEPILILISEKADMNRFEAAMRSIFGEGGFKSDNP